MAGKFFIGQQILGEVKPSQSKLDFWGPLYELNDGTIFSPGFTEYPNRNIWDYVIFTINGQQVITPGRADVRFLRNKKKDKKKAVGEDTTTVTTSGINAAEIVIELDLWMPAHKAWLDQYMQILFPLPGKDNSKQPTFNVSHPLFKAAGIKAVTVHGWEGPLKHTQPRGKIFRILCTEWVPTSNKKAGGTSPPPSLAAETSLATIGLQSLPGKNQGNTP